MALGTKNDLIRPVRREMESTRRAGAAALASILLLVACAGLYLNNNATGRDAQSFASLSPASAAEEAAKHSEQQVAHFMQEMQAVKAPKKASDSHALDWNWGPELARDKNVPNWIGSEFVKPLRNAARIRPIAPPTKSVTSSHVTALPAHPAVIVSPRAVTVAPNQDLDSRGQERIPSMLPLRFFPSKGLPPLDSRDIIKAAQQSVASVAASVTAEPILPSGASPARTHQTPLQSQGGGRGAAAAAAAAMVISPQGQAASAPRQPAMMVPAAAEGGSEVRQEQAALEARLLSLQQRIRDVAHAAAAPAAAPPHALQH